MKIKKKKYHKKLDENYNKGWEDAFKFAELHPEILDARKYLRKNTGILAPALNNLNKH